MHVQIILDKSISFIYCTYMKRGTIKAFREYLNTKFADGTNHRHDRFHQATRGYGDYLYHQDRAKFDVELAEALAGVDHKDFSHGS